MNSTLPVALGSFVCCIVPLLCFMAGMAYARYGLPFAVRFGWQRSPHELETDD